MARKKNAQTAIDNSDPVKYPFGRIQDDVTPVNEFIYGDMHEMLGKLMRLAGIVYNGLPDNESNGFQLVDALKNLPSKNDFVVALGSVSGKVTVPLRLGSMQVGESVVCKAEFNKGASSVLRGTLDNAQKSLSYLGDFNTGDYVRLIITAGGALLVRMADQASLDDMTGLLGYLKAASNAQELAGAVNTVATTPQANALAFVERVVGSLSAQSLATSIRNGLYPKEHFAIVANLGQDKVRNTGWFSGFDLGGNPNNSTLPSSGDVSSAVSKSSSGNAVIEVTFANAMDNTNYFVRVNVESQGTATQDNAVLQTMFKKISTTKVQIIAREFLSGSQSLKVHLEAVQL